MSMWQSNRSLRGKERIRRRGDRIQNCVDQYPGQWIISITLSSLDRELSNNVEESYMIQLRSYDGS